MALIFVSYVEEDSAAARELAYQLEALGHTLWLYERDSIPGQTYVKQVLGAIGSADAVLILLSPRSLPSPQVSLELTHAHERGKHLIPILVQLTFETLRRQREDWAAMIGGAVAVPLRNGRSAETAHMVNQGLIALRGGTTPLPKASDSLHSKGGVEASIMAPRRYARYGALAGVVLAGSVSAAVFIYKDRSKTVVTPEPELSLATTKPAVAVPGPPAIPPAQSPSTKLAQQPPPNTGGHKKKKVIPGASTATTESAPLVTPGATTPGTPATPANARPTPVWEQNWKKQSSDNDQVDRDLSKRGVGDESESAR